MTTAFIVTRGEYSDYRILAVYSTREAADAAMAAASKRPDEEEAYYSASVEEWPCDHPMFPKEQDGWNWYTIQMQEDGTVTSADMEYSLFDLSEKVESFGPDRLYTCVFARSKEHAIKVANERRVQYLALKGA